jgi:hypothetical protein
MLAPGMGFEPMRPNRATGSQGLRIIHSAIPATYKRIFLVAPSINLYSKHSCKLFSEKWGVCTATAQRMLKTMLKKYRGVYLLEKNGHKAKHLNHKFNKCLKYLQEVENNDEMSILRQRGCSSI